VLLHVAGAKERQQLVNAALLARTPTTTSSQCSSCVHVGAVTGAVHSATLHSERPGLCLSQCNDNQYADELSALLLHVKAWLVGGPHGGDSDSASIKLTTLTVHGWRSCQLAVLSVTDAQKPHRHRRSEFPMYLLCHGEPQICLQSEWVVLLLLLVVLLSGC
jgi:hypothetical protein